MRPRLLLVMGSFLGLALLVGQRFSSGADEPTPPASLRNAVTEDRPPTERTKPDALLPGIVFVGAPIFDEKADGGPGVYQGSYHWRDGYIYPRSATYHRGERTMGPPRPGRNLSAPAPARPTGNITGLPTPKTATWYYPVPS